MSKRIREAWAGATTTAEVSLRARVSGDAHHVWGRAGPSRSPEAPPRGRNAFRELSAGERQLPQTLSAVCEKSVRDFREKPLLTLVGM